MTVGARADHRGGSLQRKVRIARLGLEPGDTTISTRGRPVRARTGTLTNADEQRVLVLPVAARDAPAPFVCDAKGPPRHNQPPAFPLLGTQKVLRCRPFVMARPGLEPGTPRSSVGVARWRIWLIYAAHEGRCPARQSRESTGVGWVCDVGRRSRHKRHSRAVGAAERQRRLRRTYRTRRDSPLGVAIIPDHFDRDRVDEPAPGSPARVRAATAATRSPPPATPTAALSTPLPTPAGPQPLRSCGRGHPARQSRYRPTRRRSLPFDAVTSPRHTKRGGVDALNYTGGEDTTPYRLVGRRGRVHAAVTQRRSWSGRRGRRLVARRCRRSIMLWEGPRVRSPWGLRVSSSPRPV